MLLSFIKFWSSWSKQIDTHSTSQTFSDSTSCADMTIHYIDNTIIIEMTFQLFLNKSIHMFTQISCWIHLMRLSIASKEDLTWWTYNSPIVRISCKSATNFTFGSNSSCLSHLTRSICRQTIKMSSAHCSFVLYSLRS